MRIISGMYGRRRFDVPTNITARPTTDFARENLFNVLSNLIDFEGLRCLDLFAGTGAVTFEMLSRGAASVTAVETAQVQSNFIRKVASTLGCSDRLRLVRADALRFITQGTGGPYDFIFADPPYDLEGFEKIPGAILGSGLVAEGTLVVVEHSARRDFASLPGFTQRRAYGSVNFSFFVVGSQQQQETPDHHVE